MHSSAQQYTAGVHSRAPVNSRAGPLSTAVHQGARLCTAVHSRTQGELCTGGRGGSEWAKFDTVKLCQIMPRYFQDLWVFSDCATLCSRPFGTLGGCFDSVVVWSIGPPFIVEDVIFMGTCTWNVQSIEQTPRHNNNHSLVCACCATIWGFLYQISQWHLRLGAKFSPH